MGNPEVGVIFHSGNGLPMSVNNVGRWMIRRALEAIHLPWYGWHHSGGGSPRTCMRWGLRTRWCNASCATRNRTLPRNGPHAKLPMHDLTARVVVLLTDQ